MRKLVSGEYQIYWRIAFCSVIFALLYLTLTPQPPQPIDLKHIDKVYHLISFAGVSFIFKLAYTKLTFKTIAVISSLLGIAIEVVQYFIPGRGCSIADMIADLTGVIVGLLLAKVLIKQDLIINQGTKL